MAKEKETSIATPKRNKNDNLKRGGFEKGQPTPEQKKAGRERKKEALRIMNEMVKYQDMTMQEFQDYMEKNKKDIKLGSIITATRMKEIIKDKNMMKYRIDKHVPNAPVQQEISGVDGGSIDIERCNNASIEELLQLIKTK